MKRIVVLGLFLLITNFLFSQQLKYRVIIGGEVDSNLPCDGHALTYNFYAATDTGFSGGENIGGPGKEGEIYRNVYDDVSGFSSMTFDFDCRVICLSVGESPHGETHETMTIKEVIDRGYSTFVTYLGTAYVTVIPVISVVDYPHGEMCRTDEIVLSAQKGFPAGYRWSYSMDGSHWVAMKSSLYEGKDQIRVHLREILTLQEYDGLDDSPVYFRASSLGEVAKVNITCCVPEFLSGETTSPTCHGSSDGTINIQLNSAVKSGDNLIVYMSRDGIALENPVPEMITSSNFRLNGLSPGDHKVSWQNIVDGIPEGQSQIQTFTIPQVPELLCSDIQSAMVSCYGSNDGSITIQATGGNGGYKYYFKDDGVYQSFTSGAEVLSPGAYPVKIEDKKGCVLEIDDAVTVEEPEELIIEVGTIIPPRISKGISYKGEVPVVVNGWREGAQLYLNSTNNDPLVGAVDGSVFTTRVTGLSSGGYTLIARSNANCSRKTAFTVPQLFKIHIDQTSNILCHGDENGTLQAVVSGGQGNMKYKWLDNNGNVIFGAVSSLLKFSAGTYSVEATDENGISVTSLPLKISQPQPLDVNSVETVDINCYGASTGSADISVSGGTAPYIYQWSNGSSQQNLADVEAGNYYVDVTDNNGCVHSTSIISIKQPSAALQVTATGKNPLACGYSDGEITLDVMGGTSPYSVMWYDETHQLSEVGFNIKGLKAGVYRAVITDAKDCTITKSVTLTEPPALDITIECIGYISCYNNNDGVLKATAKGGVGSYQVQWFKHEEVLTGENQMELKNLRKGSYSVQVTDSNGISKMSESFILDEPPLLEIDQENSIQRDVSCFRGEDGALNPSIVGGTPRYTYSWSSGESSREISNLKAGVYTLSVSDSHGCEVRHEYLVSEPEKGLLVNLQGNNPLSYGSHTGNIEAVVEGGTPPYTLYWKKDGADMESQEWSLSDLGGGIYSLEVVDATGICSAYGEMELVEPPKLEVVVKQKQAISCFGIRDGILVAEVTGGVPFGEGIYHYQWREKVDGVFAIMGSQYQKEIVGLGDGEYQVRVFDSNDIQVYGEKILNEPDPLRIIYEDKDITSIRCSGERQGSIHVTVEGGTPDYIYRWDTGEQKADINDIAAGSYHLQVSDANGCETEENFRVTEPEVLEIDSLHGSNPRAFDGSDGTLSVEISGGVPNYILKCYNDRGDELEVILSQDSQRCVASLRNLPQGRVFLHLEDGNGCAHDTSFMFVAPPKLEVTIEQLKEIRCWGQKSGELMVHAKGGMPGENEEYIYRWYYAHEDTGEKTPMMGYYDSTAYGLGIGLYTVQVTDGNGIQAFAGPVEIMQPDQLALSYISENVSCFGGNSGMIDLSVQGGTAPYRYRWNNGAETEDLSDISEGSYSIEVSDANECMQRQEISILEPTAIHLTEISRKMPSGAGLCDGSVEIEISGGVIPYRCVWTDEKGQDIAQTTYVDGLSKGVYNVSVTDHNGCVATGSVELDEPSPMEVNIKQNTEIRCAGGSTGQLVAHGRGGVAYIQEKYHYNWFQRVGEQRFDVGRNDSIFDLVPAGSYGVVITDRNGVSVESAEIKVNQPQPVEVDYVVRDVTCFGGMDGGAQVEVTGGVEPYSYLWSHGSNKKVVNGLYAGEFLLQVRDFNGCLQKIPVQISQPELLSVELDVNPPLCLGICDGKIQANIEGGTAPYSLVWSMTSDTGNKYDHLCPGDYGVKVSDGNGCEAKGWVYFKEPDKFEVDLGDDRVICQNQIVVVQSGMEDDNLIYHWYGSKGCIGQGSEIAVSETDTISVVVENGDHCLAADTVVVEKIEEPISSEFLVSTHVYINEEVMVVDVSDPQPDFLEWVVPSGAQIMEECDRYIVLVFEQEGNYEIEMISHTGPCTREIIKSVVVTDRVLEGDAKDEDKPFIENICVHPNPSTGLFDVDVEMVQAAAVSVKLLGVSNQCLYKCLKKYGSNKYTFHFDSHISVGTYLLLIEAAGHHDVRRIIIL